MLQICDVESNKPVIYPLKDEIQGFLYKSNAAIIKGCHLLDEMERLHLAGYRLNRRYRIRMAFVQRTAQHFS